MTMKMVSSNPIRHTAAAPAGSVGNYRRRHRVIPIGIATVSTSSITTARTSPLALASIRRPAKANVIGALEHCVEAADKREQAHAPSKPARRVTRDMLLLSKMPAAANVIGIALTASHVRPPNP